MGQIFKEGVTWIWLIIENEPDNYRCLKAMQIDVHLKEKNTCLYRKAPFLPSCSDCPLSPLGFLLVWTASPYPPRPASASVRNTGNILAAVHYLPTCLLWWLVPSLLLLLCPLSNSLPLETLKKKVNFYLLWSLSPFLTCGYNLDIPASSEDVGQFRLAYPLCVLTAFRHLSSSVIRHVLGITWQSDGSFDPWLENDTSNNKGIKYVFMLSAHGPDSFPPRFLQVRSCFLSLPRKPRSILNSRISSSFLKKSVSPSQTKDSVDQPELLQLCFEFS